MKNNYEKSFIKAIINRAKEKQITTGNLQRIARTTNNIKYCKFPFFPKLSYKIANCFRGTNVKLAYYNLRQVKDLYTKLKDPIKFDERTCVIYEIPCSCQSLYIGQTKQSIKTRIQQHKDDCREEKNNVEAKTALASHHFNEAHDFNFDKTTILDTESNWYKRNISEMFWIKAKGNTVNLRTDTNKLSRIYNKVIGILKHQK